MTFNVSSLAIKILGKRRSPSLVRPIGPQTSFVPFIRANWRTDIVIENAWSTDVTMAGISLAENRWSLRDRPIRSLSCELTGIRQGNDTRLQGLLFRLAQHGNQAPLYSDRTRVTQAISSTSKVLVCDTAARRFYPGQYLGIVPPSHETFEVSLEPGEILVKQIEEVADTQILLKEEVGINFPIKSAIYPMFDSYPVMSVTKDNLNSETGTATLTFLEVNGPSALPSSAIGKTYPLVDGHPVFLFKGQADDIHRIQRFGQVNQTGRGETYSLYGTRAVLAGGLVVPCRSRALFWDVLQFWDYMRGRAEVFWWVSTQTLWNMQSLIGTTLTIDKFSYSNSITSFFNKVAFVMQDNSVELRDVLSVSKTASSYEVQLNATVTGTIKKVTSAHLVRYEEDAMVETWRTDEDCFLDMPFQEVLAEKEVIIV